MALAALAVVCLVLVARHEEQPPLVLLPQVSSPSLVTPPVDSAKLMFAEIDTFLASSRLDSHDLQRELETTPVRYIVTGEMPVSDLIDDLSNRLAKISDAFTVIVAAKNELIVQQAGQSKVVLHFVRREPPPPVGPQVAIIMDDLGRNVSPARVLLSLAQPVTFAVLPDEPQAARVAEMGYAAGREIMLHVPMEPQGYPAVNPGKDALFVRYSDEEIRRRFDALLDLVPHVAGVNNHMGSRFTEDEGALNAVMESLHARGLYFIDSLTTGHSRVTAVAQRKGVPTLSRDVFLDNVAEVDAISRQITLLVRKAHQEGLAVGICHPYPETLEALRRDLPGLAARGVEVVPISVLLKRQKTGQAKAVGF